MTVRVVRAVRGVCPPEFGEPGTAVAVHDRQQHRVVVIVRGVPVAVPDLEAAAQVSGCAVLIVADA